MQDKFSRKNKIESEFKRLRTLGSYPDPDSESGSRKATMTLSEYKKRKNIIYEMAECFHPGAEGFSLRLGVLSIIPYRVL